MIEQRDDSNRFETLISLVCEEHIASLNSLRAELTKDINPSELEAGFAESFSEPINIDVLSERSPILDRPDGLQVDSRLCIVQGDLSMTLNNPCASKSSSCFDLHPSWQQQERGGARVSFDQAVCFDYDAAAFRGSTYSAVIASDSGDRGRCMLHPHSNSRFTWDFLCCLAVLHDLIVVPLYAFDIADYEFLVVTGWITRLVWTLDIPMTFVAGFYHKGNLYMSLSMAARHYLRTSFVLDATLVAADWFFYFCAENVRQRGLFSALRLARCVRILALLRIWKMQRILMHVEDIVQTNTEIILVQINCARPIFVILLLVHVLGCGWFAICSWADRSGEDNWLRSGYVNGDMWYQYALSVHWALSQFVLNSNDTARNLRECVYSFSTLTIGIVAFSMLISNFSSAYEQLREIRSDENRQLWLLRRFAKHHCLSRHLTSRMLRYCEYAYKHDRANKEDSEVLLLNILSDPLRQELESEIHTPQLTRHPLFEKMVEGGYEPWNKLCARALRISCYAQGDTIFVQGASPPGMDTFSDGEGTYILIDAHGRKSRTSLIIGDWMCEASLWTHWVTLGQAKASVNSEIVTMHALTFQQVLSSAGPIEWFFVHRYAVTFVATLNALPSDELSDILDAAPVPTKVAAPGQGRLSFANSWIMRFSKFNSSKSTVGMSAMGSGKSRSTQSGSLRIAGSASLHGEESQKSGRKARSPTRAE